MVHIEKKDAYYRLVHTIRKQGRITHKTKYKQMKKTGWVTLVQVPPKSHMNVNVEALKILINELGFKCIYITLGKGFVELDRLFKTAGVQTSNLYFIDAISQMYGAEHASTKRCMYTAGPIDVDSITVSLRELMVQLGEEKKCILLDSVTTVLLYNSLPRTLRFSQFLTKTIKEMGVTGVMVSLSKGETTMQLIKELDVLCDEVLDFTSKKK
jgi:KaiC/GvpD/RAD55 family RecA-like ATPase